ncbi:MAG: transposase [Thermaerobacter sp.]|nr:transposase [Thermaerobacter sp.]
MLSKPGIVQQRDGERPEREIEVVPRAERRRFTAEYKLRILEEADRCQAPGEIGALLRREGLYSSHLVKWRRQREESVLAALGQKRGRKPADPLSGEVNRLRRENARLNQELEKAQKVIEVQGKVSALLRDLSLGSAPDKPKR